MPYCTGSVPHPLRSITYVSRSSSGGRFQATWISRRQKPRLGGHAGGSTRGIRVYGGGARGHPRDPTGLPPCPPHRPGSSTPYPLVRLAIQVLGSWIGHRSQRVPSSPESGPIRSTKYPAMPSSVVTASHMRLHCPVQAASRHRFCGVGGAPMSSGTTSTEGDRSLSFPSSSMAIERVVKPNSGV